jgi:Multimeric flavodoxin WrbA
MLAMMDHMKKARTGEQPSARIDKETFLERYRQHFFDPSFDGAYDEISKLAEQAWENYSDSRKAPRTQKGGAEFADPDYDLSIEWLETRQRLLNAEKIHQQSERLRFLVIHASPRNEHTCPGEYSKSYRLAQTAMEELRTDGNHDIDFLDLSLLTAEYGKHIHPCKACVSTAMPLCHWPCSCYPNNSLNQINDWMADIYEKWVLAHGVLIITPVHWYQAPSVLKLMMDRLVCADGGNPDPTTTHGKKANEAKELERKGWDYPKHLKNRAFALYVHGDVVGTETLRRQLTDWLCDMQMMPADYEGLKDHYIGYQEEYADNHMHLDKDKKAFDEIRNVVKALRFKTEQIRNLPTLVRNREAVKDPHPK